MKNTKQIFTQAALCSLFILFSLLSPKTHGQIAKQLDTLPFFTDSSGIFYAKIGKRIYREMPEKIDFDINYEVYSDIMSSISDSIKKIQIAESRKMEEEFFGFTPTTFLKEIHFIVDSEKSFFSPERPQAIFITTYPCHRPWYCESDNDYNKMVLYQRKGHIRHEICHLIDCQLKFSEDIEVLLFMKMLIKKQMLRELFQLLYLRLPTDNCLDEKIAEKFLKEHPAAKGNLSSYQKIATVYMSPAELFAQGMATSVSGFWHEVMEEIKYDDPELFEAYKQMLIVFKRAITRSLEREKFKKENSPVISILETLVKEMEQM